MADPVAKTIVDIIPVYEMGDAKKVFDWGPSNINQIITSIINQLKMPFGSLTDFPEIGCFEDLMGISFSDNELSTIHAINRKLSITNGTGVSVNFVYTDKLKENITIDISIDEIPNYKLLLDMNSSNQNIKILNPRLVEV